MVYNRAHLGNHPIRLIISFMLHLTKISGLIKICGLSEPSTLETALEEGADMVGFVHFPKSPRHLEWNSMQDLVQRTRGRALSVTLLVDPDDRMIDDVIRLVSPDIIQLHGTESASRVQDIQARTKRPVIKAMGIGNQSDLLKIGAYRQADYLLLDAKPPAASALPGGNGHIFDWTLLSGLDRTIPFMLSGGLNVKNVAGAIRGLSPMGVDVSSGVETAPGVKSSESIALFIQAARAAFAEQELVL
jgi:phosphoribosylanthranilate isomerase